MEKELRLPRMCANSRHWKGSWNKTLDRLCVKWIYQYLLMCLLPGLHEMFYIKVPGMW
jgi:hypothetical protein